MHARRPTGRVFTAPDAFQAARAAGRARRRRRADDRRRALGRPGGARGRARSHRSPTPSSSTTTAPAPSASTCCRSRVATDGGVAAVGVDGRRFRANVYLYGVEGLAEREWVGFELRLGEAVVGVRQVRGRCVMTTFDPDSLEQDISVLQKIYFELDGVTALDCYVVQPGRVRVGDEAQVLDYWTLPRSA